MEATSWNQATLLQTETTDRKKRGYLLGIDDGKVEKGKEACRGWQNFELNLKAKYATHRECKQRSENEMCST